MSCQDSVPKLSAQNFPISGMCNKRAFQPGEISNFNDIKRRRLNQGVERIKPRLTSEEIELQRLQKEKEEIERQKMQHEKYYHKIKHSRPQTSTPSLYSGTSQSRNDTPKLTNNRNDDDMDIDEIAKRPKFRARPMPKSVYTPQFTIKLSDKPLTMPIGFNLSSGNYSSQGTSVKEECTPFKARPLNKNILGKPDFVPQLGFTTPSSSAISNCNTPTPTSLDSHRSHIRHNSCSPAPNQYFSLKSTPTPTPKPQPQPQPWNRSVDSEIPQETQSWNYQPNSMPIFNHPSELPPSPFRSSSDKSTLPDRPYISNYHDLFTSKPVPNMSEPFQLGRSDIQDMDIEQSTNMRTSIHNLSESYKENSDSIPSSSYVPFSSNSQVWSSFKSSSNVKPLISSNISQEFDLYRRICGEDSVYSNPEDYKIPQTYSNIYDEEMPNSS